MTALKARLEQARGGAPWIGSPSERFTVPAPRVLNVTQAEAERMEPPAIGTAHLLLGLLREPDGLASRILAEFGLETDATRDMLTVEPLEGDVPLEHRPIATSRTKRVIENAFEEKQRTGRSRIGTEHLLVGILLEASGNAALVLARSGVTLERTRKRVVELFGRGISDSSRSSDYAGLALENLRVTAGSALVSGACA